MTVILAKGAPGGANTTANGVAASLPEKGYIRSVQINAGASFPHGRIFGRLIVGNAPPGAVPTNTLANVIAVLWAGYVCVGAGPSFPNYELRPGLTAWLELTEGSNGTGSEQIAAAIDVGLSPHGGTYLFLETPGSGQGEVIKVVVSNPAAGADFSQSVPAKVRWRMRTWKGLLTTAAAVANRQVRTIVQDPTPNTVADCRCPGFIVASSAVTVGFGIGQSPSFSSDANAAVSEVIGAGLFDTLIPAGWTIQSSTIAIAAADQWTAIFMSPEEWAIP